MKNFLANGESLQIIAPVNGVIGGSLFRQSKLVGVVLADALEGESFTLKLTGAYNNLPKTIGEAWATGDQLYLKADNSGLTTTAAGNFFVGYAYADALAADVTGSLLLSN